MSNSLRDDFTFSGNVVFTKAPTLPAQGIVEASLSNANNYPGKAKHQQATGAAVVAANEAIYVAGAAGTVKAVKAAITGLIATGGDRTVTIDVKKSTGGGAFASIMTSTIQFTNASTLLTVTGGTITTTAYSADDIFQVTVAVAGAAGNQAQGLVVEVLFSEPKV